MRDAGTDSYACGILDGCFAALGYPGTIGILLDLVAVTIACIHHLRPRPRHDPSVVAVNRSAGSLRARTTVFGEALLPDYQAFAARGAWLSKRWYGACLLALSQHMLMAWAR
jgi:hypothetical protein